MGPKGEQGNVILVVWIVWFPGTQIPQGSSDSTHAHSTCTRPHMIILQQGRTMLKGERGGKAEEEEPRRSTSRVDTMMEESSFVTQGAGFSQGWLPMAE